MGMYSFVQDWDITVKNVDSFILWLDSDSKVAPSFIPVEDSEDYCSYVKDLAEVISDASSSDFAEAIQSFFNESKIIGYWYSCFCLFIRELAQFVDGFVELSSEYHGEFAKIYFKSSSVYVSFGKIVFDGLVSIDDGSISSIPPLPDDVKLLRCL